MDAKIGLGVADARVRVSEGRRETTADAAGRFAFVGLTRRSVVLRVNAPGYRPFAVSLALGTASEEFLVPVEPERPRVAETVTVTVTESTGYASRSRSTPSATSTTATGSPSSTATSSSR